MLSIYYYIILIISKYFTYFLQFDGSVGLFSPAHPSTPVLLTNVQCSERASSLQSCTYETVNSQSYNEHSQDVKVKCASTWVSKA